MSRSYKKNPYCCAAKNRQGKRDSNRKVRNYNFFLSSGSSYKKLYCSYDICDYKMFGNFKEYTNVERINSECALLGYKMRYTKEELLTSWRKCYIMK